MPTTGPCAVRTGNLIRDYYHLLPQVVARCVDDPAPVLDARSFSPGFAVPQLDARMEDFLDVAEASWRGLGEYGSHPLHLLGLAGNPGTQTTKTFASLLIVARAVEHVRRTGERVLIFSPTSANKGVALRDAVLRAISTGLVDADRLQVVTLAPAGSLTKIRASALSSDPGLRRRNPLLCYRGPQAEDVKPLGKAFVDAHAELLLDAGVRVWSTLELRNYLIADAARAFFEHEVAPSRPGTQRWHAHAVSSAFGLIGYSVGRDVVEAGDVSPRPGYLLVQHLGTPDMVLHLRHGEFDRARIPEYARDPATGLHVQTGDPRFPATTYDPLEVLDPTFYTRRPATSPTMDALIARHGGDGIVVSLHECVTRYPVIRHRLAEAGLELPADLRTIREWSLVMVLTGVLNAIDRGLVPAGHEVVVHGSGFYTSADYEQIGGDAVVPVADVHDVATAVRRAAAG